jgi:pimeloyl-ACP methyl ester carboxylesterase
MKANPLFFIYFILTIFMSFGQSKILEERFLPIGDIEQWITIKGEDITNPVILFIHGGPGSTMSQYKDDIYGSWTKEFTLVHWDQRGAGKTFGNNVPKEITDEFYVSNPLSVEEMTNDGIDLTKYLLKYLNKRKVIIVGTSWGSILATKMVLKQPDLFHAYVGHAQFVNFSNSITNAYIEVYKMASDRKEPIAIEKLEILGPPPYNKAKNYGQLLRIVKQFEKENSTPAPTSWWKIAPLYDNIKDNNDRYNGDDYSFLNLVGDKNIGVKSMVNDINFEKTGMVFHLPIYFIQGSHDILTSKNLNKPYFERIKAPRKEYFLVSDAAHGFNQSIVNKQYEVIKSLRVQK